MNEKHTPLPWVVIGDVIYDAQDNPVACPPRSTAGIEPWPWHAHRDLIIRAVNSHATLLEACQYFRDEFLGKTARLGNGSARRAYERICAAVALAEDQAVTPAQHEEDEGC